MPIGDPTVIKNHAAFIWSVADLLRGDYKQSEYGKVILPLTVLRRMDCVLEPTKAKVLETHARMAGRLENLEPILEKAAGQQFFNAAGDLRNVSPAALDLGPLQDNGGPTFTHLPGPQSMARDAGDNAACAAAPMNGLDQRGAARPFPIGGTCDIGAVEAGASVPPTSTASPRPTASHTAMPTASPQPPTASPPPPSATPAAPVCPQITGRVPRDAIDTALADPGRVYGYGLLLDPSKPPGRFNPPRTWLSLHNLARPYHPLHNSVEFKAYCP